MNGFNAVYAAHLEHALSFAGVPFPAVRTDGEIYQYHQIDGSEELDPEPQPFMDNPLAVEMVLESLARADASSGMSFGVEFRKHLLDRFGVEIVESFYQAIYDEHVGSPSFLADAHEYVAARFRAQAEGRKWDWTV